MRALAVAVVTVACSSTPAALTGLRDADATDSADGFDGDLVDAADPCRMPVLDPAWRTVATMPALGDLASPSAEIVDFAIWQDAASQWNLLSCIRNTREPGGTRVLHGWRATSFEQPAWTAMGVVLRADPTLGETAGGLQAPFVFAADGGWRMFYGDWEHIDSASSTDGMTFTRILDASGHPQLFGEGPNTNTRDPMVLRVGDHWNAYYTAFPGNRGTDFVRTSTDLLHWSAARRVAVGGAAGDGPFSAECPFVHYDAPAQRYYLLRTQRYGATAQTTVYCSPTPDDFGVDDDRYRLGTLPVAAPELFTVAGEAWMAALRPSLDGIQVTRIHFGDAAVP